MSASGTSAALHEAAWGLSQGHAEPAGTAQTVPAEGWEGAWRSCAPRPPTVLKGKPGPDKGGGLPPPPQAPATALWDIGRC